MQIFFMAGLLAAANAFTRLCPTPLRHSFVRHSSSLMSSGSAGGADGDKESKVVPGRVALLQFRVTADRGENFLTATEYLKKASEAGAELCVLPEIWNSPYATAAFGDYAEKVPNVGDSLADPIDLQMEWGISSHHLMEQAARTGMYIVGGSVPERVKSDDDEKIYNTCIVVDSTGKIVAKHRKVHLFDVDVPGGICFKESDTLTAGDEVTCFDGPESIGKIGVGICYDIRFPEYAAILAQDRGCRVLVYPGAFNLTTGPAHWELLQRARAVDGQCYVLTACAARSDPPPPVPESAVNGDVDELDENGLAPPKVYPHYSAWGHSTAVSPWGEVVATCDEKPAMVLVDLDMNKVDEMRAAIPTSVQKRRDLYRLVEGDKSNN